MIDHALVIVIGPSYVGKTTFCSKLILQDPNIKVINHSNYRNYLPHSINNLLISYIQYLFFWRVKFFIFGTFKLGRVLFLRSLKYGYVTKVLLNELQKANRSILDEDIIKKIFDSIPAPKNIKEYNLLYSKYSKILLYILLNYKNYIIKNNVKFCILDCNYAETKRRALERNNLNKNFDLKSFRNRFCLERKLYRFLHKQFTKNSIVSVNINSSKKNHRSSEIFFEFI